MGPSDIISRLGVGYIEGATGAHSVAIAKWRIRGIPAKYWPVISRTAASTEGCKDITLEVIERAHAPQAAAE